MKIIQIGAIMYVFLLRHSLFRSIWHKCKNSNNCMSCKNFMIRS